MQLVEPKIEVFYQGNTYDHIARCARICYASNKDTNNKQLCNSLWKHKHYSMYRHAGVYYMIPEKLQISEKAYIGATVFHQGNIYYISTNEQCAREYWDKRYKKYRITIIDAFTNEVFLKNKMLRITICVETSIDITRELNRKSPNNIAEQSTRYIDFNKKLGIRLKQCHWMYGLNMYQYILTRIMCRVSEWFYKISRSKHGLNLKPEDARWILPLDTMSKVVYTYTIKEWEEIINLRLFDYTGKAHPDAKVVAKLIYDKLVDLRFNIENYNLK